VDPSRDKQPKASHVDIRRPKLEENPAISYIERKRLQKVQNNKEG
jgi:hypothetical protein